MGDLLFLCAMPMEARPLVRMLRLRRGRVGGLAVHTGRLDGRPVVAAVTGMGTRLARARTGELLDAFDVDRVVVVGITGALENDTPIGTLVVPERVVDAATGAEHRPAPLGDHTPQGVMWTGDELLTDATVLVELRGRGVVSLDMETAAIADVCEARHVPWSVFRAISDRASDGSVDDAVLHLSREDGTPDARAVARFLLTRPHQVPRLLRLAKGATLATRVAAEAAVAACREEVE